MHGKYVNDVASRSSILKPSFKQNFLSFFVNLFTELPGLHHCLMDNGLILYSVSKVARYKSHITSLAKSSMVFFVPRADTVSLSIDLSA